MNTDGIHLHWQKLVHTNLLNLPIVRYKVEIVKYKVTITWNKGTVTIVFMYLFILNSEAETGFH